MFLKYKSFSLLGFFGCDSRCAPTCFVIKTKKLNHWTYLFWLCNVEVQYLTLQENEQNKGKERPEKRVTGENEGGGAAETKSLGLKCF
jgi:hypothetical protein